MNETPNSFLRVKRKNKGQVSWQGCGDKSRRRSLLPQLEAPKGETMTKRPRNRTSPVLMSYIFIQHYTGIYSLKETFTVTAEYICHPNSHREKGVFQQKGSISKEHFETFMSFFRGCCSCSEGSFSIDDGGFFRKIGPNKISHYL